MHILVRVPPTNKTAQLGIPFPQTHQIPQKYAISLTCRQFENPMKELLSVKDKVNKDLNAEEIKQRKRKQ